MSAATSPFSYLVRPAQRALAGAGIHDLVQLSNISEAEFRKFHGIGPDAIKKNKSKNGRNEFVFFKQIMI